MSKKLPKAGFTLIELLVVITILAILAVTGFAAYRGLTSKGNDTKRDSDLKAIASVLEVNKSAAAYVFLNANQFSSNTIPDDPNTSRHYCISYTTSTASNPFVNINSVPAAWTGSCTAATNATGWGAATTITGTDFTSIKTANVPNSAKAWILCATMQDNSTVRCRSSSQ